MRSLLPRCPAALRPALLSTLGNASRLAGWFSFNLNDFTSAAYYYDDARAQAHEAENIELGAIALEGMSHVATRQGTPLIGIDHAVASCGWATAPTIGGCVPCALTEPPEHTPPTVSAMHA